MDPEVRAAKLDQAYRFLSESAAPTPSALIGSRVFDLKVRDKRHMRRAVRKVLARDHRFQEVHAGLWEALGTDYADVALEDAEFRVLDLEVTGSDPVENAIIDVAVFRVCGGKMETLVSTLVNPQRPIPPSITRLTGIDESMVADAPTFESILTELQVALDASIFVAHNAAFDYGFLKVALERSTGRRFTLPHLCTVKLSQKLIHPKTGSRKLHALATHLGIPLEHRHRAHDDAYATARVLLEVIRLLGERGVRTVGEMKLFESAAIVAPGPTGS